MSASLIQTLVRELLDQGYSKAAIARAAQVRPGTVHHWASNENIRVVHNAGDVLNDLRALVAEGQTAQDVVTLVKACHQAGYNYSEIADACDVQRQQVKAWIHDGQIPRAVWHFDVARLQAMIDNPRGADREILQRKTTALIQRSEDMTLRKIAKATGVTASTVLHWSKTGRAEDPKQAIELIERAARRLTGVPV